MLTAFLTTLVYAASRMQRRVALVLLLLASLSFPLGQALLWKTTPAIESFSLWDASTNESLGVIHGNGTKVNLTTIERNVTIQVDMSGHPRRIRSLLVQVDGTAVPSHSLVRYDGGPAWRTVGLHTIAATMHYRAWGQRRVTSWTVTVAVVWEGTILPPPSSVPTTRPSHCGGAVNTGYSSGGASSNKCTSDLWSPTGDASMHCFAYGGVSDPCSLNHNNDVNHGLDKNPASCRGDTFYLWDEPDTQGKNYTWAGTEWVKYATRFATEISALRRRGVQFTSPLLKAGETGVVAGRLAAFYQACGPPCHNASSPAYINVQAVNAFAGPWNRPGEMGCRDAAQFMVREVGAIEQAAPFRRPWYLTNWSRLGTSNVTAQVDAMSVLTVFFKGTSPIQRVYWFGATDYGGGSSNNFLTTPVTPNGPTLGQVWKENCDKL